ncbi:SWI/SNF-related matrix-associated actin-dependent regulator of chromatin [Thraustotheca clavata]|uniref:SWI/SNF-related matrix-associated actin-dependent regulator of chromatin n=1 Tax=Thraustotheca clavata TaxID=74557 RepID=A0A1V9Z844_9STRA|nr:SWI/SNF-related matrix-associated actin-dependent regulator of chromatin [Thraustotheca clavata]
MEGKKRKVVHEEAQECDEESYVKYKQLKAMDDHASMTIHRNLGRLEAEVNAPPKLSKATLVVTMSYSFGPSTNSEDDAGVWCFRVGGAIEGGPPCSRKFSHYFRKAIVDLDERLYALPNSIEWSSFRANGDTDGFEIRRPAKPGFTQHTLHLELVQQLVPERFNLTQALADALVPYLEQIESHTQDEVIKAVWEYIKAKKLLDEDDSSNIVNDTTLEKIFECKEMQFKSLQTHIMKHLTPVGSISLEYQLPLTGKHDNMIVGVQRIPIEVPTNESLFNIRKACLTNCAELKEPCLALENKMDKIIENINHHIARREWMVQFTADPTNFMDRVIVFQDLNQELLDPNCSKNSSTNVDYFQLPWVHSTMEMILHRD